VILLEETTKLFVVMTHTL